MTDKIFDGEWGICYICGAEDRHDNPDAKVPHIYCMICCEDEDDVTKSLLDEEPLPPNIKLAIIGEKKMKKKIKYSKNIIVNI